MQELEDHKQVKEQNRSTGQVVQNIRLLTFCIKYKTEFKTSRAYHGA